MNRDLRYLNLAKRLAAKSNHPVHQLGSVLVNKNSIIGIGWNQIKTHPKSPHPWKFVHAEFDAILDAESRDETLIGATCYVYRETKDGIPAMSRCCDSCMNMLQAKGIKSICYTVDGSYTLELISPLVMLRGNFYPLNRYA